MAFRSLAHCVLRRGERCATARPDVLLTLAPLNYPFVTPALLVPRREVRYFRRARSLRPWKRSCSFVSRSGVGPGTSRSLEGYVAFTRLTAKDMADQRIAFITGATGIARASARALAGRGYDIALMSRTPEDVDETASLVEKAGRRALRLTGDVSSEDDIIAAYEAVHEQFGRLDGIFANAGVNGKWAPIENISLDDWQKVIDINLTGTFLTVKHGVPHLKHSGGGSIVITSSVNGTRMFSNTGASAYASTKAAQVAFAKMMALELAPDQIRVNVICPGMIDTNIEESTEREDFEEAQYPVEYPEGKLPLTSGRPGTAEDVARLVAFLITDDSWLITGTPVWIDGAQSLFMG